MRIARRNATILVGGTVLLVTMALLYGAQEPAIVHVDVELANLPQEADGFVIVQVSDIHIGAVVGTAFVERLVERINQLGAGIAYHIEMKNMHRSSADM